jgi:hypothetical protein
VGVDVEAADELELEALCGLTGSYSSCGAGAGCDIVTVAGAVVGAGAGCCGAGSVGVGVVAGVVLVTVTAAADGAGVCVCATRTFFAGAFLARARTGFAWSAATTRLRPASGSTPCLAQ